MRVPRYEEQQVGVPSVPSVRVQGSTSADAFGAGIGEALQRAGQKLAVVAAKQQEEADRGTFALMSAKANAYAEEIYATEQSNPDYEGMNDRFKKLWKEYKEKEIQALPDRLKQQASQMFDISGLSYDGKFKGLFIQKQNDFIKAGYMQTINTLANNGDIEGLKREIPHMTLLSKVEQEGLLQKNIKGIQLDMVEKVIDENPHAEIDKSAFYMLDTGDWNKVEDMKKAGIRQLEIEQNKQDAETYDNIVGIIRHKKEGYKNVLKTIESAPGLSEQEKLNLTKFAENTYGIGEGSSGGGSKAKGGSGSYWGAMDMIDNETLYQKYPTWQSFFKEYRSKFTTTELKQFRSYYEKDGEDDDIKPVLKFNRANVARTVMTSLGIKDPVDQKTFMDNVNLTAKIADEEKRSITGKPMNDDEFVEMLSLFQKGKRKLTKTKFGIDWLAGDKKGIPMWKVPPDAQVKVDKNGNEIFIVVRDGIQQEVLIDD